MCLLTSHWALFSETKDLNVRKFFTKLRYKEAVAAASLRPSPSMSCNKCPKNGLKLGHDVLPGLHLQDFIYKANTKPNFTFGSHTTC